MIGMSTASALLREDLRAFGGYSSARSTAVRGDVWLNANESPSASPADAEGALRSADAVGAEFAAFPSAAVQAAIAAMPPDIITRKQAQP